jgi:hypothetical protein
VVPRLPQVIDALEEVVELHPHRFDRPPEVVVHQLLVYRASAGAWRAARVPDRSSRLLGVSEKEVVRRFAVGSLTR